MICPRCKELNQKSCIYPGGSFRTAAGFLIYYDENGVYHAHDTNKTMDSYTCSLGHRITVTKRGRCPGCSWGHDIEEEITVKEGGSQVVTLDGRGLVEFNND